MANKVAWIHIISKYVSMKLYNHLMNNGKIRYKNEVYNNYSPPILTAKGMFINILINPVLAEYETQVNVKDIKIYDSEFEEYNKKIKEFLS